MNTAAIVGTISNELLLFHNQCRKKNKSVTETLFCRKIRITYHNWDCLTGKGPIYAMCDYVWLYSGVFMRDCCIVVFPTDNKTGWIHDQIVGQPEQGLSQNIEHLPANYPKIHNLIPMNHSMGTMVEQPTRHATHDLYTYYIYTVPSHHGRFCIADEIDWPTHTACVKMSCHNATALAAKLFVKHALTFRLHTFSCQWALSRRHTNCC